MEKLRKISFNAQYVLDVMNTERGPRAVLIFYENEEALQKGDDFVRIYFDEDALKELIKNLKWALRELEKLKYSRGEIINDEIRS